MTIVASNTRHSTEPRDMTVGGGGEGGREAREVGEEREGEGGDCESGIQELLRLAKN